MVREVRKRDNRIVPFDCGKIAEAIYKALRSVGEGERDLADELAAAVSHFLDERFGDRIPGIEDIQDLVETVLMEMGHPKVAKSYILYRQKRALLRECLEVRKDVPCGEGVSYDYAAAERLPSRARDRGAVLPEVEEVRFGANGPYGTSPWRKGKIAAALIREADVDPLVAEEIASAVERKVLGGGARRISTSLIRELVDNELFERGFNAKLKKQQPIGLPKYNLEQIIFGTDRKEGYAFPKTPSEVREIIANRILEQYSLQEVYSPRVAEAHLEGRIFIHRLTDPIRCASIRWELPPPAGRRARDGTAGRPAGDRAGASRIVLEGMAGGARSGRPGSGPTVGEDEGLARSYLDLGDFFRRLAHLRKFASEEVRLSCVENLLLDPIRPERDPRGEERDDLARQILDRLAQPTDNPETVLELGLCEESLPWLRGLLALPPGRTRRLILAVRLEEGAFDPARGEDRAAGEAGGSGAEESPVFPGSGEAPCGPELAREPVRLIARLHARGERVEFLPPRGPARGNRLARRLGGITGAAPWLVEPGPLGEARLPEGAAVPGSPGARAVEGSGAPLSLTHSKVTINLPRAAYRSGKDRRGSVERELDEAIELAVKGHLERRQFAARLARSRENPLWDLLGRPSGAPALDLERDVVFRVGVLGLNECVEFLTGKELHEDPVAVARGLELIRHIQRRLREEGRRLGLRIRFEETDNLGPLHALEASDRRLYPEISGAGGAERLGKGYTDGVRVHRNAPVDPLRRLEALAPFLAHISPAGGVIEPAPELGSSDGELLLSLLEEGIPLLAGFPGSGASSRASGG